MRIVWLLTLLSACAVDPGPRPDAVLIEPPVAVPSGLEGWLVFETWPGTEEVHELNEEQDGWRPSSRDVHPSRVTWRATGPGELSVPFEHPSWPAWPEHDVIQAADGRILPSGSWTMHIEVDGEEVDASPFTVGPAGQSDDFDPADIEGLAYEFPEGLGAVSPRAAAFLLTPVWARITASQGAHQIQVYTRRDQRICRAWTQDGTLDAQGLFRAVHQPSDNDALPVREGRVVLGFHDRTDLSGAGLQLTVEARAFDAALTPQGEPVATGTACEAADNFELACTPCPGDDSAECLTVRSFGGQAVRVDEAALIAEEGLPGWQSLDDVEPCIVLERGELHREYDVTCSTLGSAGVGLWFMGVGALLWRRRTCLA